MQGKTMGALEEGEKREWERERVRDSTRKRRWENGIGQRKEKMRKR